MHRTCTAPPAARPRPTGALTTLLRHLAHWLHTDAATRELVQLDERMLRDVGLVASDLPRRVQHQRLERECAAWRLWGPAPGGAAGPRPDR